MADYSTEIAIVGGGICGLWLLARLRSAGYDACLFEKTALGSDQTFASQGMIHGGVKYALGGFTTPSSESIAEMPGVWRECIAGSGQVDLSGLPLLSDDYFLFSDSALSAKITAFFASKSLRGRVSAVERSAYPEAFQSSSFKGSLYQLQDIVIDTPKLLGLLQHQNAPYIFKGNVESEFEAGKLSGLTIDGIHKLKARQYIFAAGAGNEKLLGEPPFGAVKMQRRPLQQVLVKGNLPPVYAHAVSLRDADKPRVTITTHYLANGETVWYLGGNVAEKGVGKSPDALIAEAKAELSALLPWIDLTNTEWRTFNVDRAEPAQSKQTKPDFPFVKTIDNAIVCWPTKLTLTPMLADEVFKQLAMAPAKTTSVLPDLAAATLAATPWEQAFA